MKAQFMASRINDIDQFERKKISVVNKTPIKSGLVSNNEQICSKKEVISDSILTKFNAVAFFAMLPFFSCGNQAGF